MPKKLLLLGGSAQQVIAIKTAKRLGCETILCDYLPDNPGRCEADRFYLVSTTDEQAVLEVARREQVDGVLAYASDPAAPTAAYVAEKLGLPGNPYKSVVTLCSKDKFRKFLVENGFAAPSAWGCPDMETVLKKREQFHYPVIVKPVDSSGSKGATVLRSADGLERAAEFAFSFSRCHRIVIEEFVEQKHPFPIGGDVFVKDGKIVLWGLLNCHRDPRVNPLVPVGKSYPLRLEAGDIRRVKDTLSAMVEKLGIRNGPMNVELIVDKENRVFLIDVGPRSGGNMIPELLGDLFGVNAAEMSIEAAMGLSIHGGFHAPTGFYATHNLHSDRSGVYQGVRFAPELERYIYRKCLYKKPGDAVEFFDNASKCLGIVFMKFPSAEEMQRYLDDISRYITVEVRGSEHE